TALLSQPFLHTIQAIRQPILIAGQTPQRVFPRVVRILTCTLRLSGNLPLGVSELPRLQLKIAERTPPPVRRCGFELPFEIAELFERPGRARARLVGLLPPQFTRGVAHLLRDVAHLLAALRAAACRLAFVLTRLPLLTGLSGLPLL